MEETESGMGRGKGKDHRHLVEVKTSATRVVEEMKPRNGKGKGERSSSSGGGDGGSSRCGGGMGVGGDTVGNTQGMHDAGFRGNSIQGMGIFFRMPRCLGKHLLFLFENSVIVREKLLRVGFISFAELELQKTSRRDGDGDEDAYMVICGYMKGECPAWEGQDFSRGVSQEHRDLTEKLRREFHSASRHSAARQLPFSGSDVDSSDSGEALPYPLFTFACSSRRHAHIPTLFHALALLHTHVRPLVIPLAPSSSLSYIPPPL